MWSKIAEEMSIPWRAAEAMHWQLGEAEMAKRAGVTPFSFSQSPQRVRRESTMLRPEHQDSTHHHLVSNQQLTSTQSQVLNSNMSGTQLPSVAELTAGIPAYSAQLAPSPEIKNELDPDPTAGNARTSHGPSPQTKR